MYGQNSDTCRDIYPNKIVIFSCTSLTTIKLYDKQTDDISKMYTVKPPFN